MLFMVNASKVCACVQSKLTEIELHPKNDSFLTIDLYISYSLSILSILLHIKLEHDE